MVFKDFTVAIGNFNRYGELLGRKTGQTVLYILFWIIVFSVGIVIIPSMKMYTKVYDGLMSEIPEFTLTQDGFVTQREFDFEMAGFKFLATNDAVLSEDDFGDSISGTLMDKEKIIVRNWGKNVSFSYKELDFEGSGYSITKGDLPSYKPYYIGFVGFFDFFLIIGLMFSYVFTSLIVAMLCNLYSMFWRQKSDLPMLFKLSLYSRTLPFLLEAVLKPFGIAMYPIISYAISVLIIIMYLRKKTQGLGELIDDPNA